MGLNLSIPSLAPDQAVICRGYRESVTVKVALAPDGATLSWVLAPVAAFIWTDRRPFPCGWRASRAARSAAGSGAADRRRSIHGVSAVPGVTQLTRVPSCKWSAAMLKVSNRAAPFVAP